MEVDLVKWNDSLLTILKRISNAYCVVFDLEMSGIPTRKRRGGKQTLQERYEECREAAEKFHILQFGFTLVEEDIEQQKYILRTYNVNLSSLMEDVFNLDREFTYSSGAVQFLLRNGYQMGSPFNLGIPYLRPDEEPIARKNYMKRFNKAAIPDMTIRPDDISAIELVGRVNKEVAAWLKLRQPHNDEHLFTATPWDPDVERPQEQHELSGFQRRLVHQTVRRNFQQCVTSTRGGYIVVSPKNEQHEAAEREKDERMVVQNLFRQRGFRFVTDALAGRDWHKAIDTGVISRSIAGEPETKTTSDFRKRLEQLNDSLKEHKTILVGHNCFMDLVYLYHNFYGKLPDTVEDFQAALHEIFPVIADTKYLSTVNRSYESRAMQLYQVAEGLSKMEKPEIEDANDHPSYLNSEERFHEAGFDSYQTAKVFLRLSHLLESEGEYLMDELSDAALAGTKTPKLEDATIATEDPEVVETRKRKKKTKKKTATDEEEAEVNSKFSHQNAFDNLKDVEDEDVNPTSTSTAVPPSRTVEGKLAETMQNLRLSERSNKPGLLPDWSAEFWRVYGNKLRVNATQEEMCDLTSPPKMDVTSESKQTLRQTEPSDTTTRIRRSSGSLLEAVKTWITGPASKMTSRSGR